MAGTIITCDCGWKRQRHGDVWNCCGCGASVADIPNPPEWGEFQGNGAYWIAPVSGSVFLALVRSRSYERMQYVRLHDSMGWKNCCDDWRYQKCSGDSPKLPEKSWTITGLSSNTFRFKGVTRSSSEVLQALNETEDLRDMLKEDD